MGSLFVAGLAVAHPVAALALALAIAVAWLLVRLTRRRRSARPNLFASASITPTPPPALTRDQQAWLALGVPTQPLPRLHDRTPS